MPDIRPVTDLHSNLADISRAVHEGKTPVFLTKHGRGDMVIMSMETYSEITGANEIYRLIDEGLEAEKRGNVQEFSETMKEIRAEMADRRNV